ncbi:IPTL-CTERM sorting domain-containing protein [Diaphorobacter sp.]|uniref:IPTL-CTERM sorting domain-containing protein n=1 Tax=Diaphorobacter sp. TaxID=1934310 RepID=UPI0028A776EA|nr:IPTL-CTERM sorting domain-containing protein [Diaphorobacter sp.]
MNHFLKTSTAITFALASLYASSANAEDFYTPGLWTYEVPAGTGTLRVMVKGGAGGAGGWDDAHGGDGAGGTVVTATISVRGGEKVEIVVGEGGQGTPGDFMAGDAGAHAAGEPKYGDGGIGGGTTQGLPMAGGSGGHMGDKGISPGGAGGGGGSYIKINGAIVLAGGGGGGGSNSVVRGAQDEWRIPADAAQNTLVMNQQDGACLTPENGGDGEAPDTGVDGSGGSGGGGSYAGHAGQGGNNGIDRTTAQNGEPGKSGESCTLDAGYHKITVVSLDVGTASHSNTVKKTKVDEESGEAGSVTITAIPASADPVTASAAPVPTLGEWSLMALSLLLGAMAALRLRRFRSQ